MTKQEFLDRLRMYLYGKVPSEQVMENLQFYEDYINTEIRKGTTEEEVLAGLGDPRLIARTIVETRGNGQAAEYAGGSRYGNQGGSRYQSGAWYETGEDTDGAWHEDPEEYQPYEQPGDRRLRLLLKIPVWAWLVLAVLVVVLVVSAVFSLLAAILPVLIPVLLVLFVVKVFRDWFR